MLPMLVWFSEASTRASRSKAGQPVGVGGERLGQDLERHVAVELRVVGLPDFTHPALAKEGGDVVASNALPGSHQITPETEGALP